MKKNILFCIIISISAYAQSNTAVTSGSIGKCAVWGHPYTLYNTVAASQTVNSGVTVTVDQNRNIGAVNFAGTGAMNMSGANGITLSGAGGQINCRWDIPAHGSYIVVNNDGNPNVNTDRNVGTFFTAPYNGDYSWIRTTGWAASLSGAHLNGSIKIINNSNSYGISAYYRNEPGSCGQAPLPPMGGTWTNPINFSLTAGTGLHYGVGTAYNNKPGCTNTTIGVNIGQATVLYMN